MEYWDNLHNTCVLLLEWNWCRLKHTPITEVKQRWARLLYGCCTVKNVLIRQNSTHIGHICQLVRLINVLTRQNSTHIGHICQVVLLINVLIRQNSTHIGHICQVVLYAKPFDLTNMSGTVIYRFIQRRCHGYKRSFIATFELTWNSSHYVLAREMKRGHDHDASLHVEALFYNVN